MKRGSQGTVVQYWQFEEERLKRDDQGKPILGEDGQKQYESARLEKPRVFFSAVFHASQIENMPPLPPKEKLNSPEQAWERHERAEKILANSGAKLFHDQPNQAFYRPSRDEIHLPKPEQFATQDGYYATALHELGHWTGHESRLNRDLKHPFGSEPYAREELRAELASYMLGTDLGIGHDPSQHHAYIASWIETLKKDPQEIIRAARDADRIAEYVKGIELGKDQGTVMNAPSVPAHDDAGQSVAAGENGKETLLAPEKTWLNVSFKEKDEAKAAGAKWDRDEKRWYAPVGADLAPLAKWLPEKEGEKPPAQSTTRPAARDTLDPRQEFGERLRQAGLIIEGEPLLDGKIHRVAVEGGNKGAKDGAYSGYENDGHPGGWWQNHKTGEQGKWRATGHVLSAEHKAELKAECIAAIEALHKKALDRAKAKWQAASQDKDAVLAHPYLQNKAIATLGLAKLIHPYDLPRLDKNGNLLVPGYNFETGEIQTLQTIGANGEKRFQRGCQKSGASYLFPAEETSHDNDGKQVVLLAEGYATGASIHAATGLPVAVAFDAGNLKEAALAIKKKLPNAAITICADNDHNRPDGKNIGIIKAKEVAAAVGGKIVVPEFLPNEKKKGLTDFNDLQKARGLSEVRKQVDKGVFAERAVDKPQNQVGR